MANDNHTKVQQSTLAHIFNNEESAMKKVAVILSGCGVFDGAEIHEAVISLLGGEEGAVKIRRAVDQNKGIARGHEIVLPEINSR